MHRSTRSAALGFTLIELLVVIAIISLLAASLLPAIRSAMTAAEAAAVQGDLRWHHTRLVSDRARLDRYPSGSGVEFVTAGWVEGRVERTPQNFERYWTRADTAGSRRAELEWVGREEGWDRVWTSKRDVLRDDTDFAGVDRDKAWDMSSGKTPLMASHSSFGSALRDGTTIVLMGDGSIRKIPAAESGFDPERDHHVPIGDESQHEVLSKLTR